MISKRTQRTKISIIIILTILLSVVSISEGKDIVLANEIATQTDASNQDYAIYEGDGYSVEFKLDSKWTGGFNATVTIINTSDNIINNWSIIMPLDESIINIWNAEVSDYGKGNYIIKNADWNQDIPSNGSVSFGFTSNNDFSSFPKHYDILSKKITINSDDYYVSYETKNAWDKGLVGEIYIKNNKDTQIEDWTISFSYKGQIENIWDAKIISHVNDRYIISAEDYNQNIKPNSSVSFGFITDENIDEPPYDFELEEYTDGIERYIAVMAESNSDNIVFNIIGSSHMDNYKLYVSEDGDNYSLLDETTDNEIIYNINDDDSFWFFIQGEVNNRSIKSDIGKISFTDEKIIIYNSDCDKDGLCDYLEYLFGTDVNYFDSDMDGLSDYFELNWSLTNPLMMDSDENGINDNLEDFDNDNLDNLNEYNEGTNPYSYDTDNDGFSDSYELNNGMDPLVFNDIFLSESDINEANDYTEMDLRLLNIDEYYPLEIEYNNQYVTSISGKYSDMVIDSPNKALLSVYEIKSLIGLENPSEELRFFRLNHNSSGNVYMFYQIYNDIEIIGNVVVVSVDNNGYTTSLYAHLDTTENLNAIELPPAYNESSIRNTISQYGYVYNSSKLSIYKESMDSLCKYVYIVDAVKNNEMSHIIIDAISGEILSTNSIGWNYNTYGNGIDDFGNNITFVVKETPSGYYMEDNYKKIYMYDASKHNVSINSSNNTWTDPIAVTAYHNIDTSYDWWKKMGYVGLNGRGGSTDVYIHHPSYSNNARMTLSPTLQEYICLGDYGSNTNKKAPSLSVTGHEFSHSVYYNKTSWFSGDLRKQAQTIDEAYSDIFGSFIDNDTWVSLPRNTVNPLLTHNPMKVNGENYDKSFSEEHKNVTIITHAAYLMQTNGISFDKMHSLWYDSLSEGLGYWADFHTVRQCVIKAARKNGFSYDEINIIKDAFDEVGIYSKKGNLEVIVSAGDNPVSDALIIVDSYGKIKSQKTDINGKVVFNNLDEGSITLKVEATGYTPLYSQVMIHDNQTSYKNIQLLSATSTFKWTEFDHYNYKQKYVASIPKHIIFQDNDIKMIGYTVDPIKDFLLTQDVYNDDREGFNQKYLSFKIERDKNDWHTMEGGGFLFNAYINSENQLNTYCALITKDGLKIYEISGVDVVDFSDGKLGNISNVGTLLGTYDIGNIMDEHNISMRVTNQKVSIWCDDKIVVDELYLPNEYGYAFGPITSHIKHDCSQVSYFTFSDIQMSSTIEY
ncbi:MAG: cellulose binding domain-containing protein [Eubacterium sp.]|nr:cellulose binding domain-containing protein [Eubacterium sp.]